MRFVFVPEPKNDIIATERCVRRFSRKFLFRSRKRFTVCVMVINIKTDDENLE